MTADQINGLFEMVGGLLILLSCRKLYQEKLVRGVSAVPVLFFNSWGLWNLVFYPAVGAWCSFAGGLFMVAANTLWTAMLVYYRRRERGLRAKCN